MKLFKSREHKKQKADQIIRPKNHFIKYKISFRKLSPIAFGSSVPVFVCSSMCRVPTYFLTRCPLKSSNNNKYRLHRNIWQYLLTFFAFLCCNVLSFGYYQIAFNWYGPQIGNVQLWHRKWADDSNVNSEGKTGKWIKHRPKNMPIVVYCSLIHFIFSNLKQLCIENRNNKNHNYIFSKIGYINNSDNYN